MFKSIWDTVMNADQNPLVGLPKTTRFQFMTVLALMWTVIFCLSAGLFVWIPEFMIAHLVLLLLGIFGTGFIFRIRSA